MRIPLSASLILIPLCLQAIAQDAPQPILIKVEPLRSDSLEPLPRAEGFFRPGLHNPAADQPPMSLSFPQLYQPPDSQTAEAKAIAGFPEFWAKVERENGIDALRAQLGMPAKGESADGIWEAPLSVSPGGLAGLNAVSIGSMFYKSWRAHADRSAKEAHFQAQVQGLIGLTRDLSARKGGSPAISVILAKLDFMGKRVKGNLPERYERKVFTESLKAWAVNPYFDSTALGPRLAELCRAYEEFEK